MSAHRVYKAKTNPLVWLYRAAPVSRAAISPAEVSFVVRPPTKRVASAVVRHTLDRGWVQDVWPDAEAGQRILQHALLQRCEVLTRDQCTPAWFVARCFRVTSTISLDVLRFAYLGAASGRLPRSLGLSELVARAADATLEEPLPDWLFDAFLKRWLMKPLTKLRRLRIGSENEPYVVRALLGVLHRLGADPVYHCSVGLLGRRQAGATAAGATAAHIADSPDHLLLFEIGRHCCVVVHCFFLRISPAGGEYVLLVAPDRPGA